MALPVGFRRSGGGWVGGVSPTVRSCACGVTPGWACATPTSPPTAQVARRLARQARRRRLALAFGCELRVNLAPLGRQNDGNHDPPGLSGGDQAKADGLLDLRARDRAVEDLLARSVGLGDAQVALAQVAVRVRAVGDGDDRHRRALVVLADLGAGDLQGRLGARRRDADQHLEIVEDLDRRLAFRQLHRQLGHGHVVVLALRQPRIADVLNAEGLGLARLDQRRRREDQQVARVLAGPVRAGLIEAQLLDAHLHRERVGEGVLHRDHLAHAAAGRGEVEHHRLDGHGVGARRGRADGESPRKGGDEAQDLEETQNQLSLRRPNGFQLATCNWMTTWSSYVPAINGVPPPGTWITRLSWPAAPSLELIVTVAPGVLVALAVWPAQVALTL